MRYLLLLPFVILHFGISFAQKNAAFDELNLLKERYQNCTKLKSTFRFTVHYPGEPKAVQEGSFLKEKENFLLKLEDFSWIAKGSDIYFINDEAKEISISTITDDDDLLTPTSILEKISIKQYDFQKLNEGSAVMTPKTDEDYEKAELTYNLKKKSLEKVKIYNNDGSVIEYQLLSEECLSDFDSSLFQFEASNYQDYFIEDLRE